MVFPPAVAIGLMMSASLLLTGAFHEDGFADVCDGFGGGRTRDSVLAIMKDSRGRRLRRHRRRHDAGSEVFGLGISAPHGVSSHRHWRTHGEPLVRDRSHLAITLRTRGCRGQVKAPRHQFERCKLAVERCAGCARSTAGVVAHRSCCAVSVGSCPARRSDAERNHDIAGSRLLQKAG